VVVGYTKMSEIIIDGQGTTKEIRGAIFPNKKGVVYDYKATTELLKEVSKLERGAEIGQKEATWVPALEYPHLPFVLALMSDLHYGSTNVDYDLLDSHFNAVEETPNMFLATNGDHTDNFNPTKHPTGMFENPLPPDLQGRALFQRILELDKKNKVACIGQGNHDYFGFDGGQDYFTTFASQFRSPIFTGVARLNIETAGYVYKIIMNHTYWGKSKINVTNTAKRLIEYEGVGNVDIGWVGHTHESSYEYFTKGGKDIIAVVSGTYKTIDPWASRNGIGGRAGHPGIAVMFWPNERKMEIFKDVLDAQKTLLNLIFVNNISKHIHE
jgi:hypothetical protein